MPTQPHSTDFLDISNPRAVLETTLRNFSCLTGRQVALLGVGWGCRVWPHLRCHPLVAGSAPFGSQDEWRPYLQRARACMRLLAISLPVLASPDWRSPACSGQHHPISYN